MPSPSRARVAVWSALAALAAGASGHVSAQQAPLPSERPAGLLVDFVAVQADGMPVVDLLPPEVEVRINDRVRTVRSLRRVSAGPAPAAPGAAPRVPAPYGTNDGVAAGRRFVLVVDQESFGARHDEPLRNAVEGLTAQLTDADRAMVAALPFGGIRVPFTSDKTRIRMAMAGLSGQASRNETGSEQACRTRRFLESLDAFLREQTGRTSPLTVVLFTAGLAGPRRDAPMALAPGMFELVVNDFKRMAAAASAVRANFYVVHPADIGMSAPISRETIAGGGYTGSDNPLEGIEHAAGATGGVRLSLDATGTGALLRVARESSAYYVAELEPLTGEVLGRSRPLSVRVARRGVTVRARPDITLVDPVRPGTTARLTATDVLASPEAFTDLRLRAGGFTLREADGRLRVGVIVEPVDPATVLTAVGAILIAGDGRVVGRWFGRDASERPLLGAMNAPAGTYRLRVAAIDAAGRAGATEEDVEVDLTPVGVLSLGSLMLGVSRATGTTLQLEFGSEPTAIASFDIYGGASGQRVSAAVEVARTADGPALVTLPLALTRADESRVVAKGAVPLGALPAGDYVVRGVIRLEDGTTGRVTRTLRKVAR
jgi:hypothetical protein